MSSLLGIIETATVDEGSSIWILCQPITESAPKDLPEIEDIANKYWTAKIISKNTNETRQLSEWFSIPYQNIQMALETNTEGPFLIDYTALSSDSKKQLLDSTNPVFSVTNDNNDQTYRWLNR